MKKVLMAVLLVLALSSPAMALILPLNISNQQGAGSYGQLQFTASGNVVTVSANYNSPPFIVPAGSTSFGIVDIYLNLAAPSNVNGFSQIGFTNTNIANSTGPSGWIYATDPPTANLQADGFGDFTFAAGASSSSAGDRIPITLGPGFTDLFTLTYSSNVDVNTFLTLNEKGVFAAMHLAGYTPYNFNGENISSEWLAATPIPGTMYLFGSGLAGLVGIARWRRRK